MHVVEWLISGVLMTLLVGWIARSRSRPAAPDEDGQMRYPVSVLAVGLVCAVFFLACSLLSYAHPTGGPLVASVFGAFFAVSAYVIIEYYAVRHRVAESGFEYRVPTGSGAFDWSEVRSVRYSHFAKWFVVSLTSSKKVRISALLAGLPRFARTLLAHRPPGAEIDPETLAILEATAAGDPPSIWG